MSRTLPANWHPATGADYSVEVQPRGNGCGTHIYDIAPAGWADSYNPRTDEYAMQGPWDRVRSSYSH